MKIIIKYLVIFWLSFISLILIMGVTRHVFLNGSKITGIPREIILFLSTFVSNIDNYYAIDNPMIIKSSLNLNNGFNRSDRYKDSKDYLLISYWDNTLGQSIAKLIRICDGKVLYKWIPDLKSISEQWNSSNINESRLILSKKRTRLIHPFITNDGSLIFGAGYLFKLDLNSRLIWSSPIPCHHSIEPDIDGNIWICSYNSSKSNSDKYQILDDDIKKISVIDGKILFEKSIFDILMENGYNRGIFFINPQLTTGLSYLDYIHLNDVQPVNEDSRYWKKGDLFLSLRNQNLVLQYRPSTNKIIWSQNGPWLKQHDVDVLDSARIGVFGNNVIDAKFINENDRLVDGHNKQYIIDFSKHECSTPYDTFFKSAEIGTFTGGRSRIMPNNEIFVEEENKGRILYGNHDEEIWSYIEKIDEDKISMINWSRYITGVEFNNFTFIK